MFGWAQKSSKEKDIQSKQKHKVRFKTYKVKWWVITATDIQLKTYGKEKTNLGNHDFSRRLIQYHGLFSARSLSAFTLWKLPQEPLHPALWHKGMGCEKPTTDNLTWANTGHSCTSFPRFPSNTCHPCPHKNCLRDTHKHKHARSCIYRRKCGIPLSDFFHPEG